MFVTQSSLREGKRGKPLRALALSMALPLVVLLATYWPYAGETRNLLVGNEGQCPTGLDQPEHKKAVIEELRRAIPKDSEQRASGMFSKIVNWLEATCADEAPG